MASIKHSPNFLSIFRLLTSFNPPIERPSLPRLQAALHNPTPYMQREILLGEPWQNIRLSSRSAPITTSGSATQLVTSSSGLPAPIKGDLTWTHRQQTPSLLHTQARVQPLHPVLCLHLLPSHCPEGHLPVLLHPPRPVQALFPHLARLYAHFEPSIGDHVSLTDAKPTSMDHQLVVRIVPTNSAVVAALLEKNHIAGFTAQGKSSTVPPATPRRQSRQTTAQPQDQPNRHLARVLDLNAEAALEQRGHKTGLVELPRSQPPFRMDQMRRMQNHTIIVHLYTQNDMPSKAIDVVVETASWPLLDPRRYAILEGWAGVGAFNEGYHYYDQDASFWRFTQNLLNVSSKRPIHLATKQVTALPTPTLRNVKTPSRSGGTLEATPIKPAQISADSDQTPTSKAAIEVVNPIQLLNDSDWCSSDGFSYQQAPPANEKRSFPFKYARDMHEAFLRVAQCEGDHPNYKQKQLYQHAGLPGDFVSSTFSTNYQVWKTARHSNELRFAVKAGRTTEGEWSRIRSKYGSSH
ncbi:hypothetical protein V5O48_002520 [Marasmius crinis-equi]|uniref:Uncharacterized protein n=1 Tax=Marasmius crinis-equi TaxID=585013 RepID=A0ABR3FWH0_9AGAR